MASIFVQLQLPDRSAAMLPTDRAVPESAYFIFYVNLRRVRCAASRRCGKSRGSPLEAAVVSNSSDLRAAVAAAVAGAAAGRRADAAGGSTRDRSTAYRGAIDATRPVVLSGTITRVELINPHSWIHLDVTQEDGTVVSWMIEAGPPGVLVRRGWTKDSVQPGTEVMVEGYQARDGSNRANGRDVTLPDGTRLFAGSTGVGAPPPDAAPIQ